MGSQRRMIEAIRTVHPDITDERVLAAVLVLDKFTCAGDDLGDLIWKWSDQRKLTTSMFLAHLTAHLNYLKDQVYVLGGELLP